VSKLRLLAIAVIALLGVAAVAYAQSGNSYTVDGSTTVTGGSKSKPKPGGLSFKFTVSAGDQVPSVIKTYKITFEGGRVNTKVAPACSASAMDRAQSDRVCPKGSQIGSGTIQNFVAKVGDPAASATRCTLPFKIYNSGNNRAALWIQTGPPNCIAAVAKAIDARWANSATSASISFTVPDELRHQLSLDLPVSSASATIRKITKTMRVGGKRRQVGYLESIGCKDRKRDITATFTDEQGRSVTAKKTLNRC
jgi:hypothetical protein